eukprot:m.255311 g.255311  ORF g.255311 m.255311 type:complete len:74 (+) comp19426_c0_seq1:87-308(+)
MQVDQRGSRWGVHYHAEALHAARWRSYQSVRWHSASQYRATWQRPHLRGAPAAPQCAQIFAGFAGSVGAVATG